MRKPVLAQTAQQFLTVHVESKDYYSFVMVYNMLPLLQTLALLRSIQTWHPASASVSTSSRLLASLSLSPFPKRLLPGHRRWLPLPSPPSLSLSTLAWGYSAARSGAGGTLHAMLKGRTMAPRSPEPGVEAACGCRPEQPSAVAGPRDGWPRQSWIQGRVELRPQRVQSGAAVAELRPCASPLPRLSASSLWTVAAAGRLPDGAQRAVPKEPGRAEMRSEPASGKGGVAARRRSAAGGWFAGASCEGALGSLLAYCHTGVDKELRSGRQAANNQQRFGEGKQQGSSHQFQLVI